MPEARGIRPVETPALDPTPGQTVGPFFGFALPVPGGAEIAPAGAAGAVRLHGRVLDGAGSPVPDAMVELWQSDTDGAVVQQAGSLRRSAGEFTGWGRAATDADGWYEFWTRVPGGGFFSLAVFARGLMHRLFTRAYLPTAASDPWLSTLPQDRAGTLVARAQDDGFVFDIHLQGDQETVFLDFSARDRR
ncbi:protocatechuate 3,4-dioxygenase subunit alpha [Calidifontibacter sp. DB0510]|uniref:Protocatechuate 3,4-dioxygenase subunit alpha n=1 Tax=Metallococcus carri TaxID=1656884 RepID=A0A967EF36_9MICO|nr:protocatechuate 3,4-dioxygenase subunit alpha [Metallococcus carri]NHN56266.1 protocatechuate 3,4-dioxygenase subunit alpha [Metallococcus carri]NOP38682.1 protocatechuate 3,4-dioxygenase subunit alpha [Calidifontibacter sp. DB2511S]